jgi:O-antigen biosynthesis protein
MSRGLTDIGRRSAASNATATGVQFSRRFRQLRRLWGEGGARRVLDKIRLRLAERLAPATSSLPVLPADVLGCDPAVRGNWRVLAAREHEQLVVNWVTTPPSAGSGGHTTMFRLIEYLERSGNVCRVYLYDVHGGDKSYYAPIVRQIFPNFAGEILDFRDGMADAHAVIASSWPTAYPAYRDKCSGARFYLVQDFEPWFYPKGAMSTLAENTYRMGFRALTAGRFLAAKLRQEFGMSADAFDFGCDTQKYHLLDGDRERDGIVFYARPDAARRAYELGMIALQLFSERHPTVKIHLYGSRIGHLPFPFIDHGLLRPEALNNVYNCCFAGLSLSMTNVSLVPHEMLSAGCIPVVNEAEHNRIVLDNPFVRYVSPTPQALADALGEVVRTSNFAALARSASASVASASWESAGAKVEQSIRRVVMLDQQAEAENETSPVSMMTARAGVAT